MQMEKDKRNVTKAELYSVAATLCAFIFLIALMGDDDLRVYVALAALVTTCYYVYRQYAPPPYR